MDVRRSHWSNEENKGTPRALQKATSTEVSGVYPEIRDHIRVIVIEFPTLVLHSKHCHVDMAR